VNLADLKAELIGDWSPSKDSTNTTGLTLIGSKLLDEFRVMIEQVHDRRIPGEIVETGVWRGGACIWAAAVLEYLKSDKKVYVCDSFCGLPLVSDPKETISYDDAESLRVSLEEVEANFDRFGLKHRAVFVKGWFKDTMPSLNIPVSVLRLDGDMYESTRDVLKYMYDRVSPGGFVIVDDYQLPPCKQAVDELRSRQKIRGSLRVRPGVWWQKAA
jgi:hypothetical protein